MDRAVRLVWSASPKWTIVNTLLLFIQGVLPLASLYMVKHVVDSVAAAVQAGSPDGQLPRLAALTVVATGIYTLQAAVAKLAAYATEAQSSAVSDYVSGILHRKSLELDLAYYENPQFHDTLHRAQSEGPYRPTGIVNSLNQLVRSSISLSAMLVLLFIFHWSVGILLLLSTLPGLGVQLFFAAKNFHWREETTPAERRASYYSHLLTGSHFAKEVRLFGTGSFFSQAFDKLRTGIRGESLKLARQRAGAEFLSQAFAAIVLMGCFLFIAIRTVKGMITIGDMAMYFQAFNRGTGFLGELLHGLARLFADSLFVTHFFAFLDIETKIADAPHPTPIPSQAAPRIEVNDLVFSYPGPRHAVLDGVSFRIEPGEIVALVGANGAGKSTLVKLLCRLYDPDAGSISFAGIDYRQLPVTDLRRQISAVFQDFVHYYMSVEDNIRIGNIDEPVNREKLEEAARKAGAQETVSALPDGYNTMLGRWFESGEELSYGEWQKLVLARAFYRDASLVILDEPSSALDADSEYELFGNFRKLVAGKSALIISHRFSTVKMADRILVLENGKIIEDGSHDQLMRKNGRYADMFGKAAGSFLP